MTTPEIIRFGMEPVTPSIIMVAGVGGGGSNAVNHMYELGIAQVSFMICNTDRQALAQSPVPIKVRLGENLTEGLGAGNNPERGRAAALESLDEIGSIFRREGTRMVFITAGMGGGTGTGAAPVIAKAAREMGILTVGIVTLPFKAEGKVRAANALAGIEELRGNVDAMLVINNENIQEIYGKLPLTEAFGKADDILATGAKGIAEIITREGRVNVDFADVSTVMRGSGVALMGSGRSSGEGRAASAANLSLASPLLNHNNIVGARNILLNISWGDEEITLDEMYGIVGYIQDQAGNEANIIWGAGPDAALGKDIEVTIIATGFSIDESALLGAGQQPARGGFGATPAGTGFAVTPQKNGQDDDTTPPAPCGPGDEPAPRRTRFTPPATDDPHAFWAQPHRPAPGRPDEAIMGLQHGDAPHGLQQQDAPAQGNKVIEVKSNDIYKNLKDIEETPGYVRRKARMVVDAGAKTSRAILKEEPSAEKPQPKEGSLFD